MATKSKKIINKTNINIVKVVKSSPAKKSTVSERVSAATAIRKRVILAAGKLLAKQGYNGTGINQIVEESGTPRGSLYHNFPGGKDQIVVESLNLSSQEWLSELESILSKSSNPGVALQNFCKHLADELAKTKWEKGSPVATVTLEVSTRVDVVREAVNSHWKKYESILQEYLKDKKVKVTSELVNAIQSSIEGALILARAYKSKDPLILTGKTLSDLVKK